MANPHDMHPSALRPQAAGWLEPDGLAHSPGEGP